jgi:hypothetical protein
MEQRAVSRFFALKRLSPKDIHTELESMYMDEVLCLRTVYKWHERFMQERTKLFHDPLSGRHLENDIADALRAMIQEFPFTSFNCLCTHLRLAKSTCLHILHDVPCVKKFNSRSVPHSLDEARKPERVSLSTDLLTVLKEDQKNGFTHVTISDKSWSYFNYFH